MKAKGKLERQKRTMYRLRDQMADRRMSTEFACSLDPNLTPEEKVKAIDNYFLKKEAEVKHLEQLVAKGGG